jgi:hypothetical protein
MAVPPEGNREFSGTGSTGTYMLHHVIDFVQHNKVDRQCLGAPCARPVSGDLRGPIGLFELNFEHKNLCYVR